MVNYLKSLDLVQQRRANVGCGKIATGHLMMRLEDATAILDPDTMNSIQ